MRLPRRCCDSRRTLTFESRWAKQPGRGIKNSFRQKSSCRLLLSHTKESPATTVVEPAPAPTRPFTPGRMGAMIKGSSSGSKSSSQLVTSSGTGFVEFFGEAAFPQKCFFEGDDLSAK